MVQLARLVSLYDRTGSSVVRTGAVINSPANGYGDDIWYLSQRIAGIGREDLLGKIIRRSNCITRQFITSKRHQQRRFTNARKKKLKKTTRRRKCSMQ